MEEVMPHLLKPVGCTQRGENAGKIYPAAWRIHYNSGSEALSRGQR